MNHAVRPLVFCEQGGSVDTVLVAGQVVLRGGPLTRVNEERVLAEAERAAETLLARSRALFEAARAQERYTRAAIAAGTDEVRPLWLS